MLQELKKYKSTSENSDEKVKSEDSPNEGTETGAKENGIGDNGNVNGQVEQPKEDVVAGTPQPTGTETETVVTN